MEDYFEYARIFNTGNDELLLSTFFSFPFTFTTPFVNQTYDTKEEFLEALTYVRGFDISNECLQELTHPSSSVPPRKRMHRPSGSPLWQAEGVCQS